MFLSKKKGPLTPTLSPRGEGFGRNRHTYLHPPVNDPRAGFSLMEMIIVVAIIGTLAGVVAPAVVQAVHRAREAALQQDLTIMRKLIDDYHADRGVYPPTLQDLVKEGYMRAVPGDPVNGGKPEWSEVKAKDGGIEDLHSQIKEAGGNGVSYSEW